MRKILIAGGPCSGKTALVEELARRSYYTVPEAALSVINNEERAGSNIFPWTDFEEFNKRVIELQGQNEVVIPQETSLAILDRSLVDPAAYFRRKDLPIPSYLDDMVREAHYEQAFILDMLPKSYWDKTKGGMPRIMQTYEEGERIHWFIRTIYRNYGIKTTSIPFVSPIETRVDLVESSLKDKTLG